MLDLPILNVRLRACPADWQQMTPTPQGRHCSSCDREVVDFTAATQADLDAARAAAPDGRLCGRFRAEQMAAVPPQLRPKLRRFLVALVLVCGLGLTSGEAWAQVRKSTAQNDKLVSEDKHVPPHSSSESQDYVGMVAPAPPPDKHLKRPVYTYVEQMPAYKYGGSDGFKHFIMQRLRWPKQAGVTEVTGKVFVSFIITREGRVQYVKVVKGIHPAFDAEALRVIKLLDNRFVPGKQHNVPVDVRYTLPITFARQ